VTSAASVGQGPGPFERRCNEPPSQPPPAEEGEGTQYFRPGQIQQRIPGRLYYLVLLDAAASIEEPAMKDFDFFLANLVVE
jgi:hypothetical protein